MQDDRVIKVALARIAPGWLKAAAYGVVVGLVIGILQLGVTSLVYVLGGLSLVLVYTVFLIYNQFANYYNMRKLNDLDIPDDVAEILSQLDGTFRDETGLSRGDDDAKPE